MLDKILHELGWYKRPNQYVTHIEFGKFMIEGGNIVPSKFLSENDYIRIVGSKWNDGLHQYPDVNLTDETFEGAIWVMRVPSAVITLASKIEEYEKSDMGKSSPFTSESFGGYSYTKATDANGVLLSWKSVFKDELSPWRMI